MWSVEQMGPAIVEHGSPTRGGGRHAQAEEAHGGFGEDGSSHADRGLDDHGLNNVRQNVADDDAQVARSESARGLDEFAFAGGEDLSADQARVAHPSTEREREYKIEDARAAECDEGNGQQDTRKRQEGVHQHDVDEAVDDASVVAGDGTDDEAEGERHGHNATSDKHGDARAVDRTGENVAAKFVGAEPV